MFKWEIVVTKKDRMNRSIASYPVTVRGENKTEVFEKVKSLFEATYDNYQKSWSHAYTITSVEELPAREWTIDV